MNMFHRVFLCCAMTVVALIGVGALSVAPQTASAANLEPTTSIKLAAQTYGLDDAAADQAGLSKQPLKTSVLKIVSWALGSLGIIGVVLVVYAGFMWMTAAGNDDRIKKAKEIMTAAIIGIIIILLSFAVIYFITNGLNTEVFN